MHLPFLLFQPPFQIPPVDLPFLLGTAEHIPAPEGGALMSGAARGLRFRMMSLRQRQRRRRPMMARTRAQTVMPLVVPLLMTLLDLRPGRGPGQIDGPGGIFDI